MIYAGTGGSNIPDLVITENHSVQKREKHCEIKLLGRLSDVIGQPAQ